MIKIYFTATILIALVHLSSSSAVTTLPEDPNLKFGDVASCVNNIQSGIKDIELISKAIIHLQPFTVIPSALNLVLDILPSTAYHCIGCSLSEVQAYAKKNLDGEIQKCIVSGAEVFFDARNIVTDILKLKSPVKGIQDAIKMISDAKEVVVSCAKAD